MKKTSIGYRLLAYLLVISITFMNVFGNSMLAFAAEQAVGISGENIDTVSDNDLPAVVWEMESADSAETEYSEETKTELESIVETEAAVETESETMFETGSESVPKSETEQETTDLAETEVTAESETESENTIETESVTETETEMESVTESETAAETETESETAKENEAESEEMLEAAESYTVTATLVLPEDSFLMGEALDVKAVAYDQDGCSETFRIEIPEFNSWEEDIDPPAFNLEFDFPHEVESFSQLKLYVYNYDDVQTNLQVAYTLYYDGAEWTNATHDIELDVTDGDAGELPMKISKVYGKIRFPENAVVNVDDVVDDYQVKIKAHYNYKEIDEETGEKIIKEGTDSWQTFYVKDYMQEFYYSLSMLPDYAENLTALEVKVSHSGELSNIATDTTMYYDGTGLVGTGMTGKAPEMTPISFAENGTDINLTLPAAKFGGSIQLPDTAFFEGGKLTGTMYFHYYNTNGSDKSVSISVTIPEGEKSFVYYVNKLPVDVEEIYQARFKFNSSSSVTTNLITGLEEYYTKDGMSTYKADLVTFSEQANKTVIDFVPLLTRLHVKILMADDIVFSGANLNGTIYFKGTKGGSTSPDTYSKSFTISEGSNSAEFYINNIHESVEAITSTYVKWNTNTNMMTNLITGKNLYYNGNAWSTAEPENAYTWTLPSDGSMVTYTMNRSGNILPVTVRLPEGTEIVDTALTGSLQAYYKEGSSTYNCKTNFTIAPGETEVTAELALPETVTALTELRVSVNSSTGGPLVDLVRGKTFYYTRNGLTTVSGDKESIAFSDVSGRMSITLVKTTAIKGKIKLPEDAYVKGYPLSVRVIAKINNSSYKCEVKVPIDASEAKYTIALPDGTTNITELSVYAYPAQSCITNVYNQTLYYTVNGLSSDQSLAAALELTSQETNIDFGLESGDSISGEIIFPENTLLENGSAWIDILVWGNDPTLRNQDVCTELEITDINEVYRYTLPLPKDTEIISKIKVVINHSYPTSCNLRDGYFYINEEGVLVEDSDALVNLPVTQKVMVQDIYLQKYPSLSGTISLPQEAVFTGADLTGTVWVATNDGIFSSDFTIAEGTTETDIFVNLSENTSVIEYIKVRLATNSQITTNLPMGTELYCAADGKWKTSYSYVEASEIDQDEILCNLVLPIGKTLRGTITRPQEAGAEKKLEVLVEWVAEGGSGSEYFVIPEGEYATEYQLELPAALSEITYISYLVCPDYDEETNLITDIMYLDNSGQWDGYHSEYEPIPVSGDGLEQDIMLACKRFLKGTVTVPQDAILDGALEVRVRARSGNVEKISETAVVNNTTRTVAYEVEIPAGAEQIDVLSVYLENDPDVETDLLTGYIYYDALEQEWSYAETDATALAVTGQENILDITLCQRVFLSGELVVGEGSYFEGGVISGYIKAIVDEVSYIGYFHLDEGKDRTVYQIQLPLYTEEVSKIQLMLYENSIVDTNLLVGEELTYTEDGWSTDTENALSLTINRKSTVQNLELAAANIVVGTISFPEGIADGTTGIVGVVSQEEWYTKKFSVLDDQAKFRVNLPPVENMEYILFYQLDDEESEEWVTGKVYINADGSWELAQKLAKVSEHAGDAQTRNITAAKWDDLKFEGILETAHPYENDRKYEISYEYPGKAESLTLHFSRYTFVENVFDTLVIYNGADEVVGEYTGDELADISVDVQGNSFKIVLGADPESAFYGFGIDEIVINNGIPKAELAAGVVYVNGEAEKTIIHNSTEEIKSGYISAASYSADGKMLRVASEEMYATPGMSIYNLGMESLAEASSCKLLLYSDALVPLQAEKFKVFTKYGVTYQYNDGVSASRVVYYSDNEAVNKPVIDPARPGYRFKGWYTTNECEELYVFGKSLQGNVTIYAGWEKLSNVVLKTAGFGQVVSEGLQNDYALAGESVTLYPEPDEGWYFADWEVTGLIDGYEINQKDYSITFIMPENNVVVKAVFREEISVNWISTGVFAETKTENSETGEEQAAEPAVLKEITFEENTLYLPDDVRDVTLTGMLDVGGTEILNVSYAYSYFSKDAYGKEIYTAGEMTALEMDENRQFTLQNLVTGVGTNVLDITVTLADRSVELKYYLIGSEKELTLADGVTQMDLNKLTDCEDVADFATGVEAFWDYDNGTPENNSDDKKVMILKKTSEIAQRLMLPAGEENALGIGSIWIIPSCEQFPAGYSFKIVDYGDVTQAPAPDKDDVCYGMTFDSETYLYMLVEDPKIAEVFGDSFSFSTVGVDGIAFTLLPRNTVMECAMIQPDGSEVLAVAGDYQSPGSVTRKGFQYQNLLRNLVPKASVTSDNVNISLTFADTILYDHDGKSNTSWDQLVLGGDIGVENMGVTGAFEYHPSVNLNPLSEEFGIDILPQQMGMVLDYTEKRNIKLSLGGTIGGDPFADEDEPSGKWSLGDVVKSFKKQFGTGDNTKKQMEVLGLEFDIEGNDMDNTIVLAAVGFNLATLTPTASASYDQIAISSTYLGFSPILVFMVCMDLDGNVSAKITYQFSQTSYNARGFNIQQEDFKGTNKKIKKLTPTEELSAAGYEMEIFNVTQASATDKAKSVGTHTITATGEAKVEVSVTGGAALLMCGLNVAQVKGGIYADAGASVVGSAVFEKGKDPQVNVDGNLDMSIGLIVGFYSRLLAKTDLGDLGFDVKLEDKYELLQHGISSVGVSGVITEPAQSTDEKDKKLEGVKVTLKKQSSAEEPKICYTDEKGKYSFRNVDGGKYLLTLEKEGYVTYQDATVQVGTHSVRDQNYSMELNLFVEAAGKVICAKDGTEIEGVEISVVKLSNQQKVKYVKTGADGKFTVGEKDSLLNGLAPGMYKLTAKTKGYKPAELKFAVTASDSGTVVLDNIKLVPEGYGQSKVTGYIRDIATGQAAGVPLKMTIRAGNSADAGNILQEIEVGPNGFFNFDAFVGSYTAVITDTRTGISDDERYHTSLFTFEVAEPGRQVSAEGYVSRAVSENQIRIILTWGARPYDLDSHLIGPTGDGYSRFHTCFWNKTYDYNKKRYADLDLDDTTSYGPETTTIYYKNGSGIYSFYVHDYTNKYYSYNTELGNSGAVVKVYKGSSLIDTYRVPEGNGTLWHVFDYNAANGEFLERGELYAEEDADFEVLSVQESLTEGESAVQEDIRMILESLKEKE